jgi:CRISPR/Cas system-associated endoribonuclease Cas2
MAKLTGFDKVAVIRMGCCNYHYALYDDGCDYKVGDKVMLSGTARGNLYPISEIITPDEATQRFKKDITAEVVCKVDTSAYDSRVEKRKEAEKLKKEIDKTVKRMKDEIEYESFAERNPALAEMLNRYKELTE